jgi:hypothetical protein
VRTRVARELSAHFLRQHVARDIRKPTLSKQAPVTSAKLR